MPERRFSPRALLLLALSIAPMSPGTTATGPSEAVADAEQLFGDRVWVGQGLIDPNCAWRDGGQLNQELLPVCAPAVRT